MTIPCPFCQQDLADHPHACPDCGISLAKVRGLLGPAPSFDKCLLDPHGLFSAEDASRLRRCIAVLESFNRRFEIHVALLQVPDNLPLTTIGFWLANSEDMTNDCPGEALSAVLVIDPKRLEVSWTLGYGLEAWVSPQIMRHTIAAGADSYRNSRWADGAARTIEAMSSELKQVKAAINFAATEKDRRMFDY